MDSIKYNELGKVKRIKFSDGKVITYKYDATGSKLSMSVTPSGGSTTTTDYANGFVYEGGSLSFFGSPEGRVIKNGSSLEYQYSIADHQGNTRVVFSSATPSATTTTADFESGTNTNFKNYANRINFELMDRTDFSGSTYSYSQKLTGAANAQVGVTKSMKVYPGDKVKIEAYAKYYNASGSSSNLSGFALALTDAFGVSAISTGEALKAYNTLNNYGGIIAGGSGGGSGSYPKLFVNILLFDKNFNFLDASWEQINGGEQIGASPKAAHDYMSSEVTAKEEGYAYVYISNENPTLVEFYVDDVVVTHTPSNVIQYNEYYPFGLQTSSSWTRENTTGNNFLYNEGNELNQNSGWYEMFYRGYDPATGRMLQIDPYATMYASSTTYNYALNNPVMMNDPSGGLASVVGYTDSQLHTMYRESRYNGEYNDFSSWAADNLDGFGAGDRIVNGGDGSSYGFNGMGKLESGHWRFIPGTPTYDENGYPIIHSGKRVWVDDTGTQGGCCGGNWSATMGALAVSGVLVADDATVVGVVDDVVIPFLLVGAVATDLYKRQPNGTQYTLRANTSGLYPVYSWGSAVPTGTKYLNAGDIWKIGETIQYDPNTREQWRYSKTYLNAMNVSFVPEYLGPKAEIVFVQQMKLAQYLYSNGVLPAGNKGLK